MNCEILDTLYLRSNGDVPCDDDAGESVLLAHAGPDLVSVAELMSGERYAQVRASLADGRAPWPGTCEKCAFFRPLEAYDDLTVRRHLTKVQVEASLACNLRCPACSNGLQVLSRPKPLVLHAAVLEAVVRALRRERWTVGTVEYCGQGEPLLHPDFGRLVDLVREHLPATRQRVITNGNVEWAKATGRRPLEEIFVSCDGARQSSYEQYRVRGDVGMALRFLADVPPTLDGIRQTLVWKYILFEFNDSDAEIAEAQYRSQELGVDTLMFVFTHSRFASQRWTAAGAGEFPDALPERDHQRDSGARPAPPRRRAGAAVGARPPVGRQAGRARRRRPRRPAAGPAAVAVRVGCRYTF